VAGEGGMGEGAHGQVRDLAVLSVYLQKMIFRRQRMRIRLRRILVPWMGRGGDMSRRERIMGRYQMMCILEFGVGLRGGCCGEGILG